MLNCFTVDILTWYSFYSESITSKGQITIPKQIRQQPGIRKGSKLEAAIVGNHIELYIDHILPAIKSTGFAMLKSNRTAVPTDFDPAILSNNQKGQTRLKVKITQCLQ